MWIRNCSNGINMYIEIIEKKNSSTAMTVCDHLLVNIACICAVKNMNMHCMLLHVYAKFVTYCQLCPKSQ